MRLLTLVSWCPEKIIAAAIEHNVDIIGLSGLITHRWTKCGYLKGIRQIDCKPDND
jgi:methylmalonyl-CoA mutase cobalamin-binding subunit